MRRLNAVYILPVLAALTMLFAATHATGVAAQTKTVWRLQNQWLPGNQLTEVVEDWAKRVTAMSGGRLEIQMLPAGSVVPLAQSLEAIKAGVLDGHVSYPTLYAGIDPGFAPLGDIPGAFDSPYQLVEFWYYYGGLELMREAYSRFNIYTIGVGTGSFEAIPSRKPLNTLADFKGLKMRSPPGISSAIWEKLGAVPVVMPLTEVFSALEKGVIDAADNGTLSYNDQTGVYADAKYTLINSMHSNGAFDISVNKAKWDALPADLRQMLELSMRDLMVRCIVRVQIDDAVVLAKAESKGLKISELSDAEKVQYRKLAVQAWSDWSKKSPLSEKVINAYLDYLKKTGKM
ncbi:TRAP transporter substrate-binding protein DctP [Microvirga antarctica]|uniref:TRAP transporter substrate-binding protein DctP n=1 Tax=Microvirga antarctica TaxID=2819233 RepID=UPI001B302D47|nr:TRAP transporter substrate-binding protein DctP [Microvirga antarctica]